MYKKRVEFWVFFALALALVFFVGPARASAATPEQLVHSTASARGTEYLNFLGTGATSTSVSITGTLTAIHLYGIVYDNTVYGILEKQTNCSGGFSQDVLWSTGAQNGVLREYTFTGSYAFDSNSCYRLQGWAGGGGMVVYGSPDADSWPYGMVDTADAVADFYFVMDGLSYEPPPPEDTIAITFPSSTSTPIQEFTDWIVSFSQATSTTASSDDFYIKQIYVGATSTALTTLAGGSSYPPTIAPSPETIQKPSALGTGTWYAQAQMRYFRDVYDQYGTLVATSSVISFPIGWGFGASGSWATPTSTATSSEWTMTCDPDSGAFSYSLCFLAQALFVPSSGATAQFQGIGDLVSSKPPLGYFQQVKTALSGLSETTSTFALADLSSMSTSLITPIKTAIQLILWFVFGFWIFNRVRHLEL